MTALTTGPSDARPLPRNGNDAIGPLHGPKPVCRQVRRNGLRADPPRAVPSCKQSAAHVFADQGVRHVVTPVTVDVQETPAHALLTEPQLLDDATARGVLRPDVDLDAMQPGVPEAVVGRQGDSSRHDALA